MLQSLRHFSQSWAAKGLFLILIAAFSVWGIGDVFRGNPLKKTVAKVGNTEISVQELNHAFEELLVSARQKIDPNLSAQQARQMGVLDEALDSEVKRRLIDLDIKKLNINVGADAVLKILGDAPAFRTKDGQFNKELFHQYLERQRVSESTFIAQSENDIAHQILYTALDSNHDIPQTVINALYKARAEKRILDVITIDAKKISGIPAADDKALHDFYDANQAMFTAPEYRGMTVASLSTDNYAKDIAISDDQLKKEYQAKLDELKQPEHRNIIQVVVQDEDKAHELTKHARTINNLETAAKQANENAIPLDNLEEKSLMPELSHAVFSLKEGEISEPIKTQLGWHVVQLKKIAAAGTPSFDQVKDKLSEDMRHDQAIESVTHAVNQLDDELAAKHSLDDIADGLKLRLVKIAKIDAGGLLPDGTQPKELPLKDVMLKDAFAQNSGETSPIEEDKAGNYYVVRTDDVTPFGVKPFDEVKDQVASAWKLHEQILKAKAEADKIMEGLKEGKAAASFDNGADITSRTSLPISELGDTDPLLPPSAIPQTFKMKKGDVTSTSLDAKQLVLRVAQIVDVDPATNDPRKNMIEGELKKDASTEFLQEYIDHLYKIFPVRTNTAVLENLRQSEN